MEVLQNEDPTSPAASYWEINLIFFHTCSWLDQERVSGFHVFISETKVTHTVNPAMGCFIPRNCFKQTNTTIYI